MCRFVLYLGEPITIASLVSDPVHSILRQSYQSREREEPLNGDGYGIAWYPDGGAEPAVLKEVSPAWSSLNLRSVGRVTSTRCLLAHVRAATPGLPVTQLNCHPFVAEGLSFMHNGHVGGFLKLKQPLVCALDEAAFGEIQGSTDSEHLFALIKSAWRSATEGDPLARLAGALRAGITGVEALRAQVGAAQPSLLNLVLCDGRRAVVSRFVSDDTVRANSLYVHRGRRYVCEAGVCHMVPVSEGRGAVIVASEPLSEDEGWEPVPVNHLLLVGENGQVTSEPLVP